MTNEHGDFPSWMKEQLRDIEDNSQWAAHGGFYELYAQAFSDRVNKWIVGLPDAQQALATALAKTHSNYFTDADRGGRWVYDPEDNDIRLVTRETLRRTQERTQAQLQTPRP
jgi:hypothetical protein